MSQIHYDVAFTEPRNRVTTGFRLILAIPHLIFVQVWAYAIEVVTVIQWFIVLFTGKRNQGLYNFQNMWIGYASRVWGYQALMFDEYPKFGTDPTGVPTILTHQYEERANRLTNALRIIWAIPAILVTAGLVIAAVFVGIVQWFTILFTGKANRGRWDFVRKVLRYWLQTVAYVTLMTDTYPHYSPS